MRNSFEKVNATKMVAALLLFGSSCFNTSISFNPARVEAPGDSASPSPDASSSPDPVLLASQDGAISDSESSSLEVTLSDSNPSFSATGTLSYAGAMDHAARAPLGVRLQDGRLLVCGGKLSSAVFGTVYSAACTLYTPAPTNTALSFSSAVNADSLQTARDYPAAVVLSGGKVLVVGGYSAGGAVGGAEIYDPTADTWTAVDTGCDLNFSGYMSAISLGTNRALVMGQSNQVQVFDLAAAGGQGCFSAANNSPFVSRFAVPSLLALNNGMILVSGGNDTRSIEYFDPASRVFIQSGAVLNHYRNYHSSTVLPDGRILFAGGYVSGVPVATAEVFDSMSETSTTVGSMNRARALTPSHLLSAGGGAGKVIFLGGYGSGSESVSGIREVEVYDPATENFEALSSMLQYGQVYHASILLADGGRVATFGGQAAGTTQVNLFNGFLGGHVQVQVNGGTAPYTYTVNQGNGIFLNDLFYYSLPQNNLNPTIQVHDANGLRGAASFSIQLSPY